MPSRSDDVCWRAVKAVADYGSLRNASIETGIPRTTLRDQYLDGVSRGFTADMPAPGKCEFTLEDLPGELPSIEELIIRRKDEQDRVFKARAARHLINVDVKVEGPIGICHFGDPHVDDPGTDIRLLEQHINIVNKTPGMLAGNIGDLHNNWVGRLSRLYAEQTTTAREAWVLVEWLIKSVDWLYLVKGNHDVWSGAGDPLDWMSLQSGIMKSHGARLNLTFPNGAQTRINARHDFRGHSQWNEAHGPKKAAKMGWRDHILTCGHKHTSQYTTDKCPATGLISHIVRCAGYKVWDSYADELGLPDHATFPAAVTIIDPDEPDHTTRHITTILDVEYGADFLSWLRKRKGYK